MTERNEPKEERVTAEPEEKIVSPFSEEQKQGEEAAGTPYDGKNSEPIQSEIQAENLVAQPQGSVLEKQKDNPADLTPYAGFWLRFWAYLADLVVIFSLNGFLVRPVFHFWDLSSYNYWISPKTVLAGLIFYLYFVLMTKFFGQTLGKMIFGLRVIAVGKEGMSWGTILFRELVGRFISKWTWAGYVIAGIMPKKQALHDIFADTRVVIEKR
ncbi:RDD family protein [Bacillus massiliglaciei]|uniref:RDD family protein n=1 Tax=Bacillus massiliglaciei TaxID=1816693 RepID=UPI000AA27058|nr:RDD family protein [Bacillus massiliglaciei]